MIEGFDYHRALTDAVSQAPSADSEHLVWIMTPAFRHGLMRFSRDVGVEIDASEYFGIETQVGQPSNGAPFELRLRTPH